MITLTRSEIIPFYEPDWKTIMQMKHFEISVSVSQEEWQTEDFIKQQLENIMNEQLHIVNSKIPEVLLLRKQLNTFHQELKTIPNIDPTTIAKIVKKVKDII